MSIPYYKLRIEQRLEKINQISEKVRLERMCFLTRQLILLMCYIRDRMDPFFNFFGVGFLNDLFKAPRDRMDRYRGLQQLNRHRTHW